MENVKDFLKKGFAHAFYFVLSERLPAVFDGMVVFIPSRAVFHFERFSPGDNTMRANFGLKKGIPKCPKKEENSRRKLESAEPKKS